MADDLYKIVVTPVLAAFVSFGAAIMAFRPRLLRAEEDIKGKLDEKVFLEVKSHIDTKFKGVKDRFDAQGREIGEIKQGVNKLLERRKNGRE